MTSRWVPGGVPGGVLAGVLTMAAALAGGAAAQTPPGHTPGRPAGQKPGGPAAPGQKPGAPEAAGPAQQPTAAERATFGYPTVADALHGLSLRGDVKLSSQGGWLIFDDPATRTSWSFPAKGTGPYPSAVRRQIVTDGKATTVKMDMLCESTKAGCDLLLTEFQKTNAEMERRLNAPQ